MQLPLIESTVNYPTRPRLDHANMKVITTSNVDYHRLTFVHIRPYEEVLGSEDVEVCAKGGVTVCYQNPSVLDGRIVEIAVGWCRPEEVYIKSVGRYVSSENWVDGSRIQIRCHSYQDIPTQLHNLFYPLV